MVRTDSAGNTFALRLKTFRITDNSVGYAEIVKFSPAGAVLWTANLVGRGAGTCRPDTMAVDNAGNVYVACSDFFSIFGPAVTLTKLNGASGAKLWETTNIAIFTARGAALRTDFGNNVFIGGQGTLTGDLRLGLTKLNGATGATLWTRTITRAAAGISDLFSDMAVDSTGNVALVGTARSSNFCLTNTPAQLVIERVNGSTGATIWTTTHTALASDQYFAAKAGVDASGNVFAGATAFRMAGAVWVCTKRVAATGASSFAKVVSSANPVPFLMTNMVIDAAGRTTLMGEAAGMAGGGTYFTHFSATGVPGWTRFMVDRHSENDESGPPQMVAIGSTALTTALSQDVPANTVAVTRINLANGANVWDKTYSPAGKSVARCVAAAPNGDTIFTSSLETGFNPTTFQAATGRLLAANGNPVFNNVAANAVIGTPDFGNDALVDPAGNLYTTGASASRFVTEKVNSTGGLVWQNVFDSGAFSTVSSPSDGAISIGRDGAGNIVVGGVNHGSATVQKINNGTGLTMWSKRFNGVMGRNIAVASNGDVYVPIASPSQLMKLSGANGNILWTVPINGAGANDVSMFAAVDTAGNPFVAGSTWDTQACPGTNIERIMIQRCNPTTGAKLWLRELNAPVSGINRPAGLVVETTGNVQVAGTSAGATNTDIVAARLNGTSGVVLWQTRHDYLAWNEDAVALALDSTNNLLVTATTMTGTTVDGWTIKINMATGARAWSNLLAAPVGKKVPSDITRDSLNNVYVGGLVVNGTTIQHFGQKIAANGASLWTALAPAGGLETPFRNVSVAVSPANRLHVLGSIFSVGTGLSQQTLFQYGP